MLESHQPSSSSSPSEIRKTCTSDIDLLNFILSLEHFQDSFYQEGMANFTQFDFPKAGFAGAPAPQSLDATLQQLNVTPVAPCVYNFNVSDPTSTSPIRSSSSLLPG